MKIFHILFIVTTSLYSLSVLGTDYKIRGDIKGLTGWVYLEMNVDKIDSTEVKNGQFVFQGIADSINAGSIYNNAGLFVTIVPEGCEITVTGDVKKPNQIQVSGSPLTQRVYCVRDSLKRSIDRVRKEATSTEQRISLLSKWVKDEFIPIVTDNADNVAGVIAIVDNRFYLSLDEKMQCLLLLSPDMQKNKTAKRLLERTKKQMLTTEGKPYIDIQMTDISGCEVHLSDVVGNGKYVLVDFWASWCGPCIRTIPELKAIYGKYHALGFEIFGVSLDKDRNRWAKAIEKHTLNWWHVSDLKGWDCEGATIYGVEAVPATFLIDPEGMIIKNNPSISELEQILGNGLTKH